MTIPDWQLTEPLDAICFDCDGTLSTIEGIDTLAAMNGVGEDVAALTAKAMTESGITLELYRARLERVRPTRAQLAELTQAYYNARTDAVDDVVAILQRLNKPIYVLSAGVNPSVNDFVEHFNIPANKVFAVDLYFDEQGQYRDFDHDSPMTRRGGKREVIEHIQREHPRVLHIGDGVNDFEVREDVARFVGYGGAYPRENLAALCDFYIRAASLSPLLPLCTTAEEALQLTSTDKSVYNAGLTLLENQGVHVRD